MIDLPRLNDRKLALSSWLPDSWNCQSLSALGRYWDHLDKPKQWPTLTFPFPWKIETNNPWWSRDLKKGEIACSLAHNEAWKIASNQEGYTLILEDDAFGAPDVDVWLSDALERTTRYDPSWDLLYCGRVAMAPDQQFCEEKLVVPGYSHCTYGYVVSQNGAKTLVKSNIIEHMMPVDEFLPAHYMAHPRSDVRGLDFRRIRAYAVQPDIILQRHKIVFGSETEASDVYLGTS
ncbi:MAG: glycosyltransferase family 25 protein [Pseudomonadota bacterium]